MTMIVKWALIVCSVYLLVPDVAEAGAHQQWGAITAGQFTHRGREAKGFVGLGSSEAEAMQASAKACVSGTADYNGKQRCKKQLWVATGSANGYFVAAVCNFAGLLRTAVGAGRTEKAALDDVYVKARESIRAETYSLKNLPLTECVATQMYRGLERIK